MQRQQLEDHQCHSQCSRDRFTTHVSMNIHAIKKLQHNYQTQKVVHLLFLLNTCFKVAVNCVTVLMLSVPIVVWNFFYIVLWLGIGCLAKSHQMYIVLQSLGAAKHNLTKYKPDIMCGQVCFDLYIFTDFCLVLYWLRFKICCQHIYWTYKLFLHQKILLSCFQRILKVYHQVELKQLHLMYNRTSGVKQILKCTRFNVTLKALIILKQLKSQLLSVCGFFPPLQKN